MTVLDEEEIAAQKKKVPFTNYARPNGQREQTETVRWANRHSELTDRLLNVLEWRAKEGH